MKTKPFTYVLTYNRPKLLQETVECLIEQGIYPIILDDGSDIVPDLPYVFSHKHRGKRGFWQTWDEMLLECHRIQNDFFLFMPDDFTEIDIDRIMKLHEQYKDKPYAYNIINDGRTGFWTGIQSKVIDEDTIMSGMVDCGFFCNRLALEKLEFKVNNVGKHRFNDPAISSGVGQQLSMRFLLNKVPMYSPVKSLAFHGDHESKMHKEERLINPLISR